MLLVGRKRRPKTQNHLQISRNGYLDPRYVRNCTTISSIIQNCDQGLCFLHMYIPRCVENENLIKITWKRLQTVYNDF